MTNKKPTQSKHLASASLAVMGGGFIATIPFQETAWSAILHGGFEAGLVGGLADWFAVTALFRHPMGIPIPHTALLPKNRKKIVAALVNTLENDWLSKESIQSKLQNVHVIQKMIPVVQKEVSSEAVKKEINGLLDQMVRSIDVTKIAPLIEKELKKALRSIDTGHVIEMAVEKLIHHQYDEKALDYMLDRMEQWLNKNETSRQLGRTALRAIEGLELDGFMQFALKSFQQMLSEEKLGSLLQNLLRNALINIKKPEDMNRQAFLLKVKEEMRGITERKEWMEVIEARKEAAIQDWELSGKIEEILTSIQQKASAFIESGECMENYVLPFINRTIRSVQDNPEKINRLEAWAQHQIGVLVEENHSKIGKLVEENLNKLDNETLVHMMENHIGKDLQWIRVNGAVCGFFIGLVLAGIQALV
ncbi:DUF445 domain-containing protein [Domibacillus indicus]|uniref:DUF445 domain-containing protein n=1 Tax=Domibacillus indicus TaxID=1437523 RepID=UPI00203E4BD8|nr:DUF445 domain-containing protein [Domibacillus indicus]MCM3790937.1 DUF445 domain-containing protein [Domibacillus indicus]